MNEDRLLDELRSHINKILKGSFYIFIGIIITQVIAILIQILIARSLGPESYGLIVLALMVVAVSTRILQLGLPDGLTRYIARFKNIKKKLDIIKSGLTLSLPVTIVFSLLTYFGSDFIANGIFHEAELAYIIKIFSFAIPFSVLLELLISSLRGYYKAKEKVLVEVFRMGGLLTILSILFLTGFLNPATVSIFWVLSFVIGTVTASYLLFRTTGKSIKKITAIKSSFKKELLFFSFPLMISGGLAILMNNFDTIMIGYFLESTDVGIYNVAYKLAGFMLIPLSFLGYIYFPLCSKLLKENKVKELKKLLPLINKWGAVSVFPLIFLFLVYPTQVISALFGNEYIGAKYALQILTLGYLVHLLNGKTGETLKSGGYTKMILLSAIVSTIINLPLNFILIPILGIEGAAIATGMSFFVLGLVFIFVLLNSMKISPFSKNYLIQSIYGVIVAVALVYLNQLLHIPRLGEIVFLLVNIVLFYGLFLSLNLLTRKFEYGDRILFELFKEKIGIN